MDKLPYFENQGATLYYELAGSGKALVFLHGASWDGRQWGRQVDYFCPNYQVITLDARGHGRSSLPAGELSPDLFWQDLVALLDHLDLPRAILCGLSLGGHIAIQTAIRAPERVESLILIGTPFTNKFNRFERLLVPVNRFCQRLLPMTWIAWLSSLALGGKDPGAKRYIRDVVGSLDHDVFNRVWKAVTSMESREGLPAIDCPTLILIGQRDWMTRRQQQYLHDKIRGSRLSVIKNAGHGTVFDNPDQLEREIEAFIGT